MPSRAIRTAEAKRKIRIYIAIGVVVLLILLITLSTAGKQQSLRCDRLETGEVDCVVRESILGVILLNEKTIAGAQAVSIGQQCVEADCSYRLEIYTAQGLVPIKEDYTTNYDQQIDLKEELNEFFLDTNRSFVGMKEETNPALIGAVVAACVLVLAYLVYLTWQAMHPNKDEAAATHQP